MEFMGEFYAATKQCPLLFAFSFLAKASPTSIKLGFAAGNAAIHVVDTAWQEQAWGGRGMIDPPCSVGGIQFYTQT